MVRSRQFDIARKATTEISSRSDGMERVRRLIRDQIGSKSDLYLRLSRIYTALITIFTQGLSTYRRLWRIDGPMLAGMPEQCLEFRNLLHPIWVRPGTDDPKAIFNNIVRQEYGKYIPFENPAYLIDAGAYIGDTTAYFLSRFPTLKAVALEPNKLSFEQAKKNLAPYGERAALLQKALSATEGNVSFLGKEMGAKIVDEHGDTVEAVSLQSLLSSLSIDYVDILKLDIEGAEREILEAPISPWLSKVGLIIVETHGHDIDMLLAEKLKTHNWRRRTYRSLTYCWPKGAPLR